MAPRVCEWEILYLAYHSSILKSWSNSFITEKDLGFLRIGSLNVRVKRTTEAFSNFLGVGQSSEKLHKTWGSADNIQQVLSYNILY